MHRARTSPAETEGVAHHAVAASGRRRTGERGPAAGLLAAATIALVLVGTLPAGDAAARGTTPATAASRGASAPAVHRKASATPSAPAATASAPAATAPTPAAATKPSPELRPHVVTYRVAFKGMAAGDLQLKLSRESGDVWRYETRPQPSFLARMVVSASSIERGTFRLGANGVQPLTYSLDDGTDQRGKDEASFDYDRGTGRVRGYARGEPLDLELVPGLQDPLSIRAAILLDLLRGRELGEYPMIDGRQIRTYVYRRAGTETLKTAVGTVETVVYTSAREGADARAKTWKYWYAPSLGWLPVRIQQIDKGQPRLAFEIRSVEFQ